MINKLAIQTLPVDVIMNTVLDGLITIDRTGYIQSFNPVTESNHFSYIAKIF